MYLVWVGLAALAPPFGRDQIFFPGRDWKKMGVAVDALLLVLLVFFDGRFGKSGDLVW